MNRPGSKTPSLFAALLAGLLVNILLYTHTGYWTRVGALLAPVSVAILACMGWLFARSWQGTENVLWRILFALLLLFSSVLELLRLWQLANDLYPDGVALASVCLTALLPVIYLRRVSSISQTANVMLCLLLLATGVMLLSVLPRLRVQNLQMPALALPDLSRAVRSQWVLYPEFLLPALWPQREKRGAHTVLRLAAATVGFGVGAHLVLELFFGAAMPARLHPMRTAAQSGSLSIFNRLEWMQLLLWTMVISLKLALYLYAVVRLGGGRSKAENSAVGLDRFPLYFGGMLLACVLLRNIDLDAALQLRNTAAWILAGLVGTGGGLKWLLGAKRPA